VVVGISSEDPKVLDAFVKKSGINYPIASADKLPLPYDSVQSIPDQRHIESFVIATAPDSKGILVTLQSGKLQAYRFE
jgi:peroxiredoxin